MTKNKIISNLIAIILILVIAGIYLFAPLLNLFSNLPQLKQFVLSFGIFAPLILTALVILQVLFAPIPGQTTGLASGFLFGPVLGTVYSMIGLVIGSFIAFYLSRKFGRPFVERIVNKKTLRKLDNLSSERGIFGLFLIYLLPALPDDVICYIAGLTNIKIKNLMIISTIGRLPGFIVLNLVGAGFASQSSLFAIILFIIFMLVSLVLFIYKDKLERLMLRIIQKTKKYLNES